MTWPSRASWILSTLTIVTDPANGQAIPQADGTVTYVPNAGFFGMDTFQYTITDTFGNVSEPTTVKVNVVESGLENPLLFGDVNANGEVTALDALLVINKLSEGGGQAGIPVNPDDRGPNFYDVSGNLEITSLDALLVINHIGQDAPTLVAGELVSDPIVADSHLHARPSTGAAGIGHRDPVDRHRVRRSGEDCGRNRDPVD